MSNNADFVDTLQLYRRLQEVGKGAITDELMSLQEFFDEILQLVHRCREAFLEGSNLLEIEGTIRICGDIHGQFYDLMRLQACGGPPSPHNKYLFLGDYVDRGRMSLETICMLFCLFLRHPGQVYLLRGNHECASINKVYGFYQECRDRFPAGQGVKIWRTFADAFNCMPIAALVNQKIFCIHGGLSPELRTFQQIRALMRPTDIPETGLLCDLLWSDPKPDLQGWDSNDRGVSYTFGANVVKEFCDILQIDLVCRAHQVVEDGYEFFADQKLVTIFSAPNYTGEFDNRGAILTVTAELVCSLQILSPKEKPARVKQVSDQFKMDAKPKKTTKVSD